jgi:hypothetical protein
MSVKREMHGNPMNERAYVLATDYASLLAVLRQCVGWMEDQFCPEDARCAKCSDGYKIVAAAKAKLEE